MNNQDMTMASNKKSTLYMLPIVECPLPECTCMYVCFIEVAENCGERAALYRDLRIPAHDDHVLQTREARTGIECLQMCTANFPSCISAYHNDEGWS